MLSLVFLPFYLLVNVYVFLRLRLWLIACFPGAMKSPLQAVLAVLYTALAVSPAVAFFTPYGTVAKRLLQTLGNIWFGLFLYTILAVVGGHLLSLLLRRLLHVLPKEFFSAHAGRVAVAGWVTLALIAGIFAYGTINAGDLKIRRYDITIEKEVPGKKDLRVVLVADFHLGYSVGQDMMRRMTDRINAENADLVCIAGDIYDNDFNAIDDPDATAAIIKEIQSTYGTYACWGNHDVDQKILGGFTFDKKGPIVHNERMTPFLEAAGITMLEDETLLIDDAFYLVGRVDRDKPATPENARMTPEELLADADKSKPVLVLYHEPDELEELSAAGCDVVFSGHTHDGQLFPGNLIIRAFWPNSCGYERSGALHSIVTSGVGVWGPNLRVGTDAEIVVVDLHFQ